MQDDAFAYCAALVRANDRDRYLATLFAPERQRGDLFALYAFAIEIGRVRELAREALPGEIRLQWWSDVLAGARAGEEAAANPVAAALLAAIGRHGLAGEQLTELIETHRFDLYDEPMATLAHLQDYLQKTSSAVIALAGKILGAEVASAAAPAGIALGIAELLYALPRHAAQRRLYVPVALLQRHGVGTEEVFAGRASPGLSAALSELGGVARRHLDLVQQTMRVPPGKALPAFLPLAPLRRWLARLQCDQPFDPKGLSAWRRQWLIWRAARNPARITG